MSGFIKTDMDGVNALKTLAAALPNAVEKAQKASDRIQDVFEGNREFLGPHTSEINGMLDDIDEAQKLVGRDIEKVKEKLLRLAAKLMAIVQSSF